MKKFLFSIITACLNSAKTIGETIESLQSQDISPDLYEHIFIDGASQDNTLDIIRQKAKGNVVIVSEKDDGIYDAFNKGIKLAKGDFIYFLNSSDTLKSNDVLSFVKTEIEKQPNTELIYGKVAYIRDNGTVRNLTGKQITPENYWNPMECICHQGLFTKKSLFENIGLFKLHIKGGIADRIWLIDYFHKEPKGVVFIDKVIANFHAGGYAESHAFEAALENFIYVKDNLCFSEKVKNFIGLFRCFLLIKILKAHKDTWFRRLYRKLRYGQ
ncbi:MAG: glycosyltransferase [Fibromonadaceae bacterium]|jgi:glycosyltransferase involved in cell wall biosynthesis|nr:glycosyltransferase [Fibromonadaceae bacterium]